MALITEDLVIPPVAELFPRTRYWHDVKPCGTLAAYRRHLRRKEPTCRSCRQANNRARQDYRKKIKKLGIPNLGGRWPRKEAA